MLWGHVGHLSGHATPVESRISREVVVRISDGPVAEAAASGRGKLQTAMKGAIFREVVLAKVREMKEQEQTLKITEEVEKEAKRRSFHG